MNGPCPTRVVIAGGGTAGWTAAAALVRQLAPLVSVTLVESDAIGTVGVGESTIPTARGFHQLLGIDEASFMRATQASFKLGISFEGWGAAGERYFHPFGAVARPSWVADFHHFWLEARARGMAGPWGSYSPEHQAALAGRFALRDDVPLAYAYHLDATGYARFLRSLAEPAGVRRVEGLIERVERDAGSGDLAALVLASGERIEGDLFVDCTGFRALLIGQALGVGFEDWGEWIRTDRALAVQSEAIAPPVPFTRAIAHGAGWRWQIPLQTRVGNGLVYASEALSDDEAAARLLGAIEGPPLSQPRPVRFATGTRMRHWHRNCVALGLAAGFVEPLESTSIHLIHQAVTRLVQLFPFDGMAAPAARFNREAEHEWRGIRDFIILHYHLTRRDDTQFWRRARTMAVPDSLAERLRLLREAAIAWQGSDDLFRIDSWVAVALGQGLVPQGWHRVARMMPGDALADALADLRRRVDAGVAALPSLDAFIGGFCSIGPAAKDGLGVEAPAV
jgi:tryptophan halogenase